MSTVQQLELEVVQPPPAPREQSHTQTQPDPVHSAQRPSAAKLLETPGALLTRSHLRALGLERRAVDAVFRALPVVALPGYSRPLIRAADYLQLVEQHTFRGDRVRPSARGLTL
jgi:hypothetical protein